MIKVAIVEDDALIRKVLTEVLASAKDCQCIGAFADGASAVAKLPSLAPDVILMDINLPDLSGVECVARIAPQLPGAEIIMLTVFQDPETIFRALVAGAHGYSPPDGTVLITAERKNGRFAVQVINSVENLTAEDVPRLFDRSWRKDPARSSAAHAGLGLSLARAFADSLDCTLEAAMPAGPRLVMTLAGPAELGPADPPPDRKPFLEPETTIA